MPTPKKKRESDARLKIVKRTRESKTRGTLNVNTRRLLIPVESETGVSRRRK